MYKDIETICRRITQHKAVCLLLELPERKQREEITGIPFANIAAENYFYAHITDAAEFHNIEMRMTEYRAGYYSSKTKSYPVYKSRTFLKDCEDFSLLEKCDHLSAKGEVFNCFGDYESSLISQMNDLLQPDHDKCLLDSININLYMQAVSRSGTPIEAPMRLLPVDIRAYSIYSELVNELFTVAAGNGFDGFHCEYVISGNDRCSLIVFIEDKEDRWDGRRYQVNFRISLYQMPGVFHDSAEGRTIREKDSGDNLYALDTIIVNGDKCNSLDDFSKWADSFFFGFRVD